ncbi:hypothetical protein [Arthrobacter bambusae]|uniref:HNH endonuclease n=1 Tax=Arthrobacter bambusae TaxID=1338426 RepID=A0AAW8D9U8_9MICC|nr:hypothetical protein [Arthrobacter bambusae]MDP9903253.1 hypothetical protein [Arthrobacter bambusae]MDQ0128753.1 hypothetical protein [Arthrobacter bambusae]MDQ0180094.1 hypothetical protein [Arthrobacter bambusae]
MNTHIARSAILALLGVALAGCAAMGHASEASSPRPTPAHSASEGTTQNPVPTKPAGPSALVVSDGAGWSAAGLEGQVPAPGSCHVRKAADGGDLPDPACTPGARDGRISDTNVDATIGRPGGYTASVRPPAQMTEAAKKKILGAYGIPWSEASKYELDHYLPLCLGSSSDVRNLWPQRNVFLPGLGHETSMVHNSKDLVEDYLCDAVKKHKIPLSKAQDAMVVDWTTAVQALGLPPIPASDQGTSAGGSDD